MAELERAHTPDYVRRVLNGDLSSMELRRLGFPWSEQLVTRSLYSAGATLAACRHALAAGSAATLAGGTHHAHADHGAGFCVFNDAAVAARVLHAEGRVRRTAIIDCDVHQGDGTASIMAGNDAAFTLSLHGARNYPFAKAHSSLDIALADGTEDGPYLAALADGLDAAIDAFRPDLVIYLAGADPFAGDRLGRLALSKEGLRQRDQAVIGRCRTAGIPMAVAMAGSYAEDIADTVAIHLQTLSLLASTGVNTPASTPT